MAEVQAGPAMPPHCFSLHYGMNYVRLCVCCSLSGSSGTIDKTPKVFKGYPLKGLQDRFLAKEKMKSCMAHMPKAV